jgi:hypothetical protein
MEAHEATEMETLKNCPKIRTAVYDGADMAL